MSGENPVSSLYCIRCNLHFKARCSLTSKEFPVTAQKPKGTVDSKYIERTHFKAKSKI